VRRGNVGGKLSPAVAPHPEVLVRPEGESDHRRVVVKEDKDLEVVLGEVDDPAAAFVRLGVVGRSFAPFFVFL